MLEIVTYSLPRNLELKFNNDINSYVFVCVCERMWERDENNEHIVKNTLKWGGQSFFFIMTSLTLKGDKMCLRFTLSSSIKRLI